MDVDAVDLAGVHDRDAPAHRGLDDLVEEALAVRGRQELGVGHARDVPLGPQHDRRGHDRPGQAPAAHFIDTRHVHVSQPPQLVLDAA